MQHAAGLQVTGVILGPLDLVQPLNWAPARLWSQDGEVRFEVVLDVDGRDEQALATLKELCAPAVEAAVMAATGTAVEAVFTGSSSPVGGMRRVTASVPVRWAVRAAVDSDPGTARLGQSVLKAVLLGADRRLPELYKVYILGVQAVQTIAPLVGLSTFTTVLEEDAPGRPNLRHVPELVERLRREGYAVPAGPARQLDRIRAAALHPTPRDPLPTAAEVEWFRVAAQRYLQHRAAVVNAQTERARQQG